MIFGSCKLRKATLDVMLILS